MRLLQVSPQVRDFFAPQLMRFPLNARVILKTIAAAGSRDAVTPRIVWGAFPFDSERPLVFNTCERLRAAGLITFTPPDAHGDDGAIWFVSPFLIKLVDAQTTAPQRVELKEVLEDATPPAAPDADAASAATARHSTAELRGGDSVGDRRLMLECASKCSDDMASQVLFETTLDKVRQTLKQRARSIVMSPTRGGGGGDDGVLGAAAIQSRRSSMGLSLLLEMDGDDEQWAEQEDLEEKFQARGEDGGGRAGRALMFMDDAEARAREAERGRLTPGSLLDMLALYVPWQLVLFLARQRPNIISDDPFSMGRGPAGPNAAVAEDSNDQRLPISINFETACLVVQMSHRSTLTAQDTARRSRMIFAAGAAATDADDGNTEVAKARLQVGLGPVLVLSCPPARCSVLCGESLRVWARVVGGRVGGRIGVWAGECATQLVPRRGSLCGVFQAASP
jgi:hypothetical protein